MRNKTQARDRRRGEVEAVMEMNSAHAAEVAQALDTQEDGARRMMLLFAWLNLAANGEVLLKDFCRRTERVLEEIRAKVGNGPQVQVATADWLCRGFVGARFLLKHRHADVARMGVFRFIGDPDDTQRLAPMDLDTCERWLEAGYVPAAQLSELRTKYWLLIFDIIVMAATEKEADELRDRARRHIAKAHHQGVRGLEDEWSYGITCRKLGINPGPAWSKTPRELQFL